MVSLRSQMAFSWIFLGYAGDSWSMAIQNQDNVDFERRGTTDSLPVEELLGLENPGFPRDSPGALQSTPPA